MRTVPHYCSRVDATVSKQKRQKKYAGERTDCPWGPASANLEVVSGCEVVEEQFQDSVGLLLLETDDVRRESRVDIAVRGREAGKKREGGQERERSAQSEPERGGNKDRTHSAFSPVTGCLRTIGCSCETGSRRIASSPRN
jgi:hypothetical protein